MEIENKTGEPVIPQINSFYARLLSNSWLFFMLAEFIMIGVIVAIFLLIINYLDISSALVISVAILVAIQSVIIYLLLCYALQPIKIIVRHLSYSHGEPSAEPLPDRNNPKFKKSGLSLLINTIFDNDKQTQNTPSVSDSTQQLLRELLASLPVGFIAMKPGGGIIATNSLAPILTTPDGQRQIQLDFSNANDSLDAWLKQVTGNEIEAEKIWTHIQNVAPDQPDRRVFDVVAHYRQDRPGNIETVIITIDRTAEYWGEEDNSDFVALAAHELRGPITVIRGYLDILDEQMGSQMTPEQHELVERLTVSAKRLASYVNNILNASRYDHKHMKLQLAETTLTGIVDDVKDDLDLRAKTQNRSIVWDISPELPTVATDRSSVGEVFSNLIDNAIKYSYDNGQIFVSAIEQDGFIAVSIRDYGVGIPAVVVSNLFSKFYRSHRSRDVVGGTGIGLFISRGIIESHGGSVNVESVEGQGSTFTFTLPIYSTVADKLANSNDNSNLIRKDGNWIRNHSRIQG